MDPFTAFVALGVLPALIDGFMESEPFDEPPNSDPSYGFDQAALTAAISPFLRSRTPAPLQRPVAVAPGTGPAAEKLSPVDRLVAVARPFSIQAPQVLEDGSVYAIVEGPFWSALAVEASKVARQTGRGLQISVGLGAEVSVAEGSVTPTVYRFVSPTR